MTESDARAAVVAEALTWLRTPWHHRSAIKGVGVDCGQFPLRVYANVGLVDWFDTGEYARDHMLHSTEERFLGIVQSIMSEVDPADGDRLLHEHDVVLGPGDLLLYKFGRVYSHAALVTSWPQIIHPLVTDGCVTLGDADRDHFLIDKPVKFFSYWARHGR